MSNDATDLLVDDLESTQPAAQGFDLILLDLAAFCTDAEVLSVVALTSTSLRVTFERPVLDNVALRLASAYTLIEADENGAPVDGGHAPIVVSVTPQSPAPPSFVDLTTSEMREGLVYQLSIAYLEAA